MAAKNEAKETGGYFLLGAMLGAAIGAAVGLLYAPRPGSETRRDLHDKSEALRDRAQEISSQLESRSEAILDRAREIPARTVGSREAGSDDGSEAGEPAGADDKEVDLPPGEDLL